MDKDRVYGTARNLGGKVEEGVGRVTGDKETQLHGQLDQMAGTPLRTSTGRPRMLRARRLGTSTNGYATQSRLSLIQRQSWRSASAGSSAGCTDRSDRSRSTS